jgi:hypothetical protein
MPGVVQEIDLVISKEAEAQAIRDAQKSGTMIVQNVWRGMEPGSKEAGKKLADNVTSEMTAAKATAAAYKFLQGLRTAFQQSEQQTKELLARGLITPQEATRRGREAARAFNAGLASQIDTLRAAGAPTASIQAFTGQLKTIAQESPNAVRGMATVRSGLIQVAAHAAGTRGPIGTLLNGLLAMGPQSFAILAVVAGVGIMIKVWDKLTASARAVKKATDDLVQSLRDQQREQATSEDANLAAAYRQLGDLRRQIREQTEGRFVTSRTGEGGTEQRFIPGRAASESQLARLRELEIMTGQGFADKQERDRAKAKADRDQEFRDLLALIDNKQKLTAIERERLRVLTAQIQAEARNMTLSAAERGNAQSLLAVAARPGERAQRASEMEERATRAADRAGFAAITSGVRLVQGFWEKLDRENERAAATAERSLTEARKKQIQEQQRELEEAVRGAVNTIGSRDWEPAFIKNARESRERFHALGQTISRSATAAIDFAHGLGIVDENMARMLDNMTTIASRLPGALNNLSILSAPGGFNMQNFGAFAGSALPVLGAAGSLLGSMFGESPEERAMREALESAEDAIRTLTKEIGNLDIGVSGRVFAAAERALAGGGLESRLGTSFWMGSDDRDRIIGDYLEPFGLAIDDLRAIAEGLGIEFVNSREGVNALTRAMKQAEITAFGRTWEGRSQQRQLAADILNQTLEEQLGAFLADATARTRTGTGPFGSQLPQGFQYGVLGERLQGVNLATEAGVAAAQQIVQQLFREFPNLRAEQLGNLDPMQFLDALREFENLLGSRLDDLKNRPGPNDLQFTAVQETITRTEAFRIDAQLTQHGVWLREIAMNTRPILSMAGLGGGGVLIRFEDGAFRFAGGFNPGDSDLVSRAIIDGVNQGLGERLQRTALNYGQVTL